MVAAVLITIGVINYTYIRFLVGSVLLICNLRLVVRHGMFLVHNFITTDNPTNDPPFYINMKHIRTFKIINYGQQK